MHGVIFSVHKILPLPGSKGINKMSVPAAKLMKNSFYGKLIEDLGPLPSNVPCWMQEICSGDVRNNPCTLRYVSDFLKLEEMCNEAMRNMPCMLLFAPGHLKTQKMCIKAAKVDP